MRRKCKLIGLSALCLAGINSMSAYAMGTGYVTADYLNVRALPSTESEIVGGLYYGEEVDISDEEDGWYVIWYGDSQAYICSDYVNSFASAGEGYYDASGEGNDGEEDGYSDDEDYNGEHASGGSSWSGETLNAYNGVVMGPSGKETYYNLDMSGVIDIMRGMGYTGEYWIREDGVKMLGDYIMCAANLDVHPRGSLVESSLGTCIVCDTGGFAYEDPNQLDIAVNW